MENINILCVDDQRTVLTALTTDLEIFEEHYNIEACESAQEAWKLMEKIDTEGGMVALVISDHVMPGKTGVEFLTEINKDGRFRNTKKLLLTGLATQQDTIVAINKAQIDRFFEKPYAAEELISVVKKLMTAFLLEAGIDYQSYTAVLDQEVLLDNMRKSSF